MKDMRNVSKQMERFYQIAMIAAKMSTCRFPMACILVKGSRVISVAVNVIRSHPKQDRYGDHCISIHAELNAILLAQSDVTGSTAYVARRNGTRTSKPCPVCQVYMKEARIARAIYWNKGLEVIEL